VRPYFLACVVDCIANCFRLAMMNPCGAAAIVNLRFLRRYPAFVIFSEIGAAKFSKIFEKKEAFAIRGARYAVALIR
jgi:hypothetical protein